MNKNYNFIDLEKDSVRTKSVHSLSSWWGIVGIIFILFLGFLSNKILQHLPHPSILENVDSISDHFIAERAWRDLKNLTDIGPKVRGTVENEVLAVNFLKEAIGKIIGEKTKKQNIVLDHQIVSGAFPCGWDDKIMTNVYTKVQNIVVKLVGTKDENSLLLNCHYDTVASSPGASDDGGSCAILLEILRVFSRQETILKNTIIFLFNGAEEYVLEGSHGFITQHSWSRNVRAFINLESAGSGGKEILFQSGPKNQWLLQVYSEAVIYPFANAAGEEIFQSGIIPSDTDFRIFRDFGRAPGLDFAHMSNGYRYHTKYDTIDYIPLNVLQRTGDNILGLTKIIGNSDELKNVPNHIDALTVFFDYLGIFMVSYSADFGVILNISISVLAFLVPYLNLIKATAGSNEKVIRTETISGFLSTFFMLESSFAICYLIGYLIEAAGKSMSWYSSTYLVIGIYCGPVLLIQVLVQMMFRPEMSSLSHALITQARLNGTNLFWGIVTILITLKEFRIGYVFMVILFFSLLSSLLIMLTKTANSINKWLYIHIFFQIFVILWSSQYFIVLLKLFVPLSGRGGGKTNPEIAIGALAAFGTFFTCSFLIPLVQLLKTKKMLMTALLAITSVSFCLAIFTNIGFPYRDENGQDPTVQRQYVTHTLRNFYNLNGTVRNQDSGYLLRKMDRNTERTLKGLLGPNEQMIPQYEISSCEKEIYCAIPFYSFFHQFNYLGYWIPSEKPIVKQKTLIILNNITKFSQNKKRFNFTLKGSFQTALMIRPKHNVTMTKWSLMDHIPDQIELNNDKAYFITISRGYQDEDLEILIEFKTENVDFEGSLVDITVVTTHWEYHNQHSAEFSSFLSRFPAWTHAIPSVAVVDVYTF